MKARRDLTPAEVDQIRTVLQRRLGDTSVPTLPQVAVRIIELVNDPEAAVTDFTEVIQADQALTGRLLRMANSAVFGQREPVTRIERAMVLLGLQRLKALALGFHLTKALRSTELAISHKRIWTQSLFRGWLALRLGEQYCKPRAGECFVVGLLSDAGLPMMPKLVGEQYAEQIDFRDPPAKMHLDESMKLPFTHADVAAALASLWKLPDLLAEPVANHHDLPDGVDWNDPVSSIHSIACFVGAIPLDPQGMPVSGQPFRKLATRLLRVDPSEVEPLISQAAEDYEACKSMFAHVIDDSLTIEQIVEQANEHLAPADEVDLEESAHAHAEPADGGAAACFSIDGLRFEIEPSRDSLVTVYIADEAGNRLLAEQIHPDEQPADEIRRLLMLESAPDGPVEEMLSQISGLAA